MASPAIAGRTSASTAMAGGISNSHAIARRRSAFPAILGG